jgi:hypothetical protein
VGGCLEFNGSEDYVEVPDDPSLDISGPITIEYWIWLDEIPTGYPRVIVNKGKAFTGSSEYNKSAYGAWVRTDTDPPRIVALDIYQSSPAARRVVNVELPTGEATGTWHHVVGTWDGTMDPNSMRSYLNGMLNQTETSTVGMINAIDRSLVIGDDPEWSSNRAFDGRLDELRIYPRALSAQQVRQRYLDTKDGHSDTASIADQDTLVGEVWTVEVTPTDGMSDGLLVESDSLTILAPPDEIGCRLGRVNLGASLYEAVVLTVNGSEGDALRKVTIQTGDGIEVYMDAPPAGPATAKFALYVWLGEPSGSTVTPHPQSLGNMCFPTPITGGTPAPKKIWNNIGKEGALGTPDYPSSPAPSMVFAKPSGLSNALTATFQGLIYDQGSSANKPASVTNAVTLVVQ